ncbi:MAG: fused MFS/spermidine synthase [Eubacteriales bacterium]|nr:fused MFS/spermidine synthase [Eubacteriales bacterium]
MDSKILNNKWYLYLTEFFAGMAVMAVELGASRLLAPYFSSSQIVWTIIISTIMIAMALGNIYGGRSADKDPNPDRLYVRLLIAAVWIAAIPVLGKYVILLITGLLIVTINSNLLVIAGFLACMVIFVFPCFLLGTVTPSLTKFAVQSLDDSGKTVGTLNASNTIGSIIGTFTPTFITIPAVGTSITFLIFSGIILLLALVYFFSCRRKQINCIIAIVLFVICSIFGNRSNFAFWEDSLTYEGESIYNYLQVKEDDNNVILSTNVLFGVQSIAKKDGSLSGMYYDYAMLAPLMAGMDPAQTDGADVLILGNGSGTYARQLKNFYPNIRVTGVEIDQSITDLAHTYFDLPKDVNVVTYDGRAYLQADAGKYDVIMVDAFQDITVPFQMSSVEFFTMVRNHLKQSGVMVINQNMRAVREGNINEYLSDTIAAVFPYVSTVDVMGYTNRELFASMQSLTDADINTRIQNVSDPKLRQLLQEVSGMTIPYEKGGYLLTDDRAPVELLSMRAVDDIIRDELSYYKKVFREEGLDGILHAM